MEKTLVRGRASGIHPWKDQLKDEESFEFPVHMGN